MAKSMKKKTFSEIFLNICYNSTFYLLNTKNNLLMNGKLFNRVNKPISLLLNTDLISFKS